MWTVIMSVFNMYFNLINKLIRFYLIRCIKAVYGTLFYIILLWVTNFHPRDLHSHQLQSFMWLKVFFFFLQTYFCIPRLIRKKKNTWTSIFFFKIILSCVSKKWSKLSYHVSRVRWWCTMRWDNYVPKKVCAVCVNPT